MQQVLDTGHIGRSMLIDPRRLGFSIFNFFFDATSDDADLIIDFFKRRRECAWLIEHSGPRRYEVTLILPAYWQLEGLFDELGQKTGAHLYKPLFAMPGNVYHWGLRFLGSRTPVEAPMMLQPPSDLFTADELDVLLLRQMREGAYKTVEKLARSLGVASSTVTYRIERLRAAKVVSDDIFFAIGEIPNLIQAQILLTMQSRSKSQREQLLAFCQEAARVEQLITCVGQWDFKLMLYSDNVEGVFGVEEELAKKLSTIVSDKSLFIRRRIMKSSLGF